MAEIDTTKTFVPGDSVTADIMNNIIDEAFAKPEIITGQDPATPVPAADYILFYDASATLLKKCKIDQLPSGVTSVHLTATPTSIFTVTGTPTITTAGTFGIDLDDQTGNKVLAAPADGSSATPSFRALVPEDLNAIISVAANTVNLALGHAFWKVLPDTAGARVLNLVNGTPGQKIRVIVQQGAAPGTNTLTWDAPTGTDVLRWPGGTPPVMTTGAHRTDIYEFTLLQSGTGPNNYYGIRWGANFDV